MATKLTRLVSLGEEPPPKMSHDPVITLSGDHMTNEKRYITTSTRPFITKFDKEVASDERMLSKKFTYQLITWTHQVTWLLKSVIYLFPQDMWPPKLEECWLVLRSPKLHCPMSFWSRGHVRSRDK